MEAFNFVFVYRQCNHTSRTTVTQVNGRAIVFVYIRVHLCRLDRYRTVNRTMYIWELEFKAHVGYLNNFYSFPGYLPNSMHTFSCTTITTNGFDSNLYSLQCMFGSIYLHLASLPHLQHMKLISCFFLLLLRNAWHSHSSFQFSVLGCVIRSDYWDVWFGFGYIHDVCVCVCANGSAIAFNWCCHMDM